VGGAEFGAEYLLMERHELDVQVGKLHHNVSACGRSQPRAAVRHEERLGSLHYKANARGGLRIKIRITITKRSKSKMGPCALATCS